MSPEATEHEGDTGEPERVLELVLSLLGEPRKLNGNQR